MSAEGMGPPQLQFVSKRLSRLFNLCGQSRIELPRAI